MATIAFPMAGHKYAKLTVALADDNALVANAVVNVKIKIMALWLSAVADNTIQFKSDTTAISSIIYVPTDGGMVLPYNPYGWFETLAAEDLNMTLTVAALVGVNITYILTT